MNKLFYAGFLILVLSIIGLIVVNNVQVENEVPESINQININTSPVSHVKEIVNQDSDQPEDLIQVNCLLDKGVIIEGNCEQFANLDKMDLEKYTNLRLHADFEQMLLNSRLNSLPKLYSLFVELGESDQGLVYQVVSFDESLSESDLDGAKKVDYLFNSKLNNISANVLDSELYQDMDAETEAILRKYGIFKEPGSPLEFECLFKNQLKIFIENGYVLEGYKICEDFPEDYFEVVFEEDSYFEDYTSDSLKFENGESAEDFSFNDKCAFEYFSNIVSTKNVKNITCFNLTKMDEINFSDFINVELFVLRGGTIDLDFLNNYSKVKKIELYDIDQLNASWLSNVENLTDLIISGSNVINVSVLNSSSFQLNNIRIQSTNIDNLDFLSSQYQLKHVNLSNMELINIPLFGSMEKIETLILKNNEITKLSNINNFSNLLQLDVRRNKIEYMSQVNLENGVLKSFNITFNPLDCEDSALYYSPIVKSSCNSKLKKQLQ